LIVIIASRSRNSYRNLAVDLFVLTGMMIRFSLVIE
jgi:hypothetical protein